MLPDRGAARAAILPILRSKYRTLPVAFYTRTFVSTIYGLTRSYKHGLIIGCTMNGLIVRGKSWLDSGFTYDAILQDVTVDECNKAEVDISR